MKLFRKQEGFTLAELLIVVAIIAVLVAISIPIFTSQLEKSREATDLANVRSAYAEVMSAAISNDKTSKYYTESVTWNDGKYIASIDLKQQQSDWQGHKDLNVGGVVSSDSTHWLSHPTPNGLCTVTYDIETGETFLNWNGKNIATNLGFMNTAWNGYNNLNQKQHNEHNGEIISTWNTGNTNGKYPGVYELEKNTTYKVSFTYDPHLDDKNNPTKGIVAKATILWDENGNKYKDSGTGDFVLDKDTEIKDKGVQYRYTTNKDGTLTYTATFTTGNKTDKYYYGMNFGAMTIKDLSTGELDKNSALKFVGDSGLGMTQKEFEELQEQLRYNFVLEKVTK